MRLMICSVAIGTGVLFMTMCSPAPRQQTAVRVSDSDLEKKIEDHFRSTAELGDVSADADVSDNKVTLKGDVATEAARNQAVEYAKASHPGIIVEDKIDVKPRDVKLSEYTEDMAREARTSAKSKGEKVGDSLEDAWIHTKIVTKLMADADTPSRNINVDVVKNVVTLRGKVETAEAKNEAARIARETDGVRRVTNLLSVEKS